MDLKDLEAMVRRAVSISGDKALEVLGREVASHEEFALAAGTLSDREVHWPEAPDDPDRPWN